MVKRANWSFYICNQDPHFWDHLPLYWLLMIDGDQSCLLSQNWSNWADSNLEVGIISFEAIKNYNCYIISKATIGKGAICLTRSDGGPASGLFSKLLIASSTNFLLFSKFWFASLVLSICCQVTPVMISVHRFPVLPPWHKWLPWCWVFCISYFYFVFFIFCFVFLMIIFHRFPVLPAGTSDCLDAATEISV